MIKSYNLLISPRLGKWRGRREEAWKEVGDEWEWQEEEEQGGGGGGCGGRGGGDGRKHGKGEEMSGTGGRMSSEEMM